MASTQEAEIQFAQRLASNEKPVRSKALLKLRRYISGRSGREQGGFGEDDLLKIWKGLFYCMWMQDKPLLQEELACKISGLVHSFQTADSQLLFFSTFLHTMKREWNGIDRLRMDKFYQLVRFVFREVFEMLKRRKWDSSVVSAFLQQFSAQLLHSSSAAPAGLVHHVLDLYTTELARVGSAQLTAMQNLTFIEPFCKTMAKTKDRVLLKAIGSNIFDTIIDQVPFAIDDLLRELRQAEREEDLKKKKKAQDNGGWIDQTPSMCVCDHGVLSSQFDYSAIADRLFEVASHSNIPSFNRSKIYKFVKIFRDLCEGLFPQNKVEDVSTDEDEYDDGRRKRKTKKQIKQLEARRKAKAGQSETSADPDKSQETKQKNKKGKKKKRKNGSLKSVEGETDQQSDAQTAVEPTEPSPDAEKPESDEKEHPAAVKLLKKRRRRKPAVSKTNEDNSQDIVQKDGGEMELTCSISAGVDEPTGQETTDSKASPKTLVKKKKKQQKNTAAGAPEPSTNGVAHQTVTLMRPKKRKQKTGPAEEVKPERKKRVMEEEVKENGHAMGETSGKRPKIISEASALPGKQKQFVLRQKKAPTPLFCKAAGYMLGKKVMQKKVRFGLKNNKTMEFRKMDRSSQVSPASQSRVPFDPKRTPKSSVLKSPSSSPAVTRRAMAADFF
ncbi:ribosomal RNA processing protein 1 homolog A [Pseudorasbora parva]|uniref:ribosomal RNA processing protein 1 homolog A n=1 Tax=Pseudorasbora parva TaxID=51549 RepID=UPI00351EADB6